MIAVNSNLLLVETTIGINHLGNSDQGILCASSLFEGPQYEDLGSWSTVAKSFVHCDLHPSSCWPVIDFWTPFKPICACKRDFRVSNFREHFGQCTKYSNFRDTMKLSSLSATGFTRFSHPAFPGRSARIKKTHFCDGEVKYVVPLGIYIHDL